MQGVVRQPCTFFSVHTGTARWQACKMRPSKPLPLHHLPILLTHLFRNRRCKINHYIKKYESKQNLLRAHVIGRTSARRRNNLKIHKSQVNICRILIIITCISNNKTTTYYVARNRFSLHTPRRTIHPKSIVKNSWQHKDNCM